MPTFARMRARRHARAAPYVLAALLSAGCRYHVEATPLRTYIQRPATCLEAVTVYERAEDVKRRYVPLAELSLWAPGDMVVTAESEVKAEQMKAATWGANGLILGHPRHTPQSFNDKTVAIFVPADSALAVSVCERERARHKG